MVLFRKTVLSALLVTAIGLSTATGHAGPPHNANASTLTKIPKAGVVMGTTRTDRVFIAWKKADDASAYCVYRDGLPLAKNIKPTALSALPTDIQAAVMTALNISDISQFWSSGSVGSVNRETIREILAGIYAEIAVAMGLGYTDHQSDGLTHHYEVRKIVNGQEIFYSGIDLAFKDCSKELPVPDPHSCKIVSGDQRISIYWPDSGNSKVVAYDVTRDGKPLGALPVTAKSVPPESARTSQIKTSPNPVIKPKTKQEPMYFFTDATVLHPQPFILANQHDYHYRIVPRDLLGAGSQSTTLTGTPTDLLPPKSPNSLGFQVLTNLWNYNDKSVPGCCAGNCTLCGAIYKETLPKNNTVYKYNVGLHLTWHPVYLNTEGDPEEVASYTLTRYGSIGDANQKKNGKDLTTIAVQPGKPQPAEFSYDDKDIPSDTVRWYRVAATDKYNHTSYSNVYTLFYKDNTPPAAPAHVRLDKGELSTNETSITILWDANKEPDLAGYYVYRRICGIPNEFVRDKLTNDHFQLIATLGKSETSFTDKTLPVNSPVCYEYSVRAYDKNQNVSLNTMGNVTCGRLKKTIGPAAPTITSLQSRSNAIRIGWVAPPVPDLYSFRVLRSEDGTNWVQVSPDPKFPSEVRCQDTPPQGKDWVDGLVDPMKEGKAKNSYTMLDTKGIKPRTKYWYKVVSIDYFSNPQKGSVHEAHSISPAMSTYTYDRFVKNAPVLSATFNSQKGVILSWQLPMEFSDAKVIVYRSGKATNGDFQPIATATFTKNLTDNAVCPGKTYWYKIQFVTASGHYSEYSKVVAVNVPDDDGD